MSTNINLWVDYIGEQSVPLFQKTVHTLLGRTKDESVTCKELVDCIIRDAALTARIVKVANSSYYNRTQVQVHDIRRAVLMIGFNKIYEICLTSTIIETLIRRSTYQHVYELMARSFCAAVYANAIATKLELDDIDELFLSALLWNFGEIAFWSLSGQAGSDIAAQLNQAGRTREEAQRQLLGITFNDLTVGLSKKWHLTKLLAQALDHPAAPDKRIECIRLGYKLTSLHFDGFSITDKGKQIQDIARLTRLDYIETIDFINDKMRDAKQIAFLHLAYDLNTRKTLV